MYDKLNHFNLNDCVTKEDLVQLFETAFTQWNKNSLHPVDRREAPRVTPDHTKPLFVVSYSYNGREIKLYQRAPIVDISANGLGVVMAEPLPVGATLCFAFENKIGERNFGIASVVRLVKHNNDYQIGLAFTENAQSLDTYLSDRILEPWGAWFGKGCHTWQCIRRSLTRRRHVRRSVEKKLAGTPVRFEIEVKLFRYIASLYINGRKVNTRTGPLKDRLRNLFSDDAISTTISLEAGGFVAWATLRTNKVSYINIQCEMTRQRNDKINNRNRIAPEPAEKTLLASLQDIESNLHSLSVS